MINAEYVFFDLDGTLTDPAEGITNSVAYALSRFGIPNCERSGLYKFIGPPLIDSFMKYYGFSKQKALKAVEYYREYFSAKGIFENTLYDGITDLLKCLKSADKKIVLATSKPDKFAKIILEHFKISEYFDFLAGATMNETRTQKDEVIAYALENLGINDTSSVIMIGDRKYDIEGAHKFGIPAVGVLYGYGSSEELLEAKADYTVSTVKELNDILKVV